MHGKEEDHQHRARDFLHFDVDRCHLYRLGKEEVPALNPGELLTQPPILLGLP